MRRYAFAVSVAIAILVAACGTTEAPPAAQGSAVGSSGTAAVNASASTVAIGSAFAGPSAAPGTFASGLYDYHIDLPAGWEPTAASSRWLSGVLEGKCPSDWDCLTSGSDSRTLAVAAIKVPADLTLHQWRLRIHLTQPATCSDAAAASSTSLGGDAAESWPAVCPSEGLTTIKMVAIHGGQGYVLIFASPSEDSLDADAAAFAALVEKFQFAA